MGKYLALFSLHWETFKVLFKRQLQFILLPEVDQQPTCDFRKLENTLFGGEQYNPVGNIKIFRL